MTTRMEIRPSKHLFTGNLIYGRPYLLSVESHNINKFYWIEHHFKQLLDNVILNGSLSKVVLSKEEIYPLLFLAANGLVEFTIDGELFSKIALNANLHAKRPSSTKTANQFNAILYKTNSPFSIKLELTTSCNLRCKYCYMRGAKNALVTSRQWIEVLERLRQLGVVRLEITGGEPLLYEDLSEIVQAADGIGFDTTICTNGVLIDSSLAELIKKSRSVDLRISFHSVDRNVFERFVQVKGAYSKVIDSFHMLLDADAPFSAFIVLTSINEATIFDTIAYLEEAHIKFDISAFIFPNLYTTSNNHEYRPSSEIVANLVKKKYLSERRSKCSALRTKFWISCNGDVFPCEMYRHFKVGNILESACDKIWTSKIANDFRDHVSQTFSDCDSCKHSSYCGYCPALCEIYSKSLTYNISTGNAPQLGAG